MGIAEDTLLGILDSKYKEARANAAEELHNAIVDAINEQHSGVETTLYVLEMVKDSVVRNQQNTTSLAPADNADPTRKGKGWRGERDKKKD